MVAVCGGWYTGHVNLTYCYTHFLTLTTAMIVLSTLVSVFVYIKAKAAGAMLAEGGNSGV